MNTTILLDDTTITWPCRDGGSNKQPRRRKVAESEDEVEESEEDEESDDASSMAELSPPAAHVSPPSSPAPGSRGTHAAGSGRVPICDLSAGLPVCPSFCALCYTDL